MTNESDHMDEYVMTQRANPSEAHFRIASEMAKPKRAPAAVMFTKSMIARAIGNVERWSASQDPGHRDDAARAYGWLLGMPSPFTAIECCEHLDYDHAKLVTFVHAIPGSADLRGRLIEILTDTLNETQSEVA